MDKNTRSETSTFSSIASLFGTAASSALKVRSYRAGDEVHLAAVWNLAYDGYAGYIRRSVEQWRWCILDRPGIDKADIIILEKGGEVIGYGVLGPKGAVLEMAVDQRLSFRRREKVAERLTVALEERSRARGDETISFVVPTTDEAICQTLLRYGYRGETNDCLNMAIVDLPGLLRKILNHRKTRIPAGWTHSFQLELEPGYYRFCPYRRVHVQLANSIAVTADPDSAIADSTVRVDLSTLTDLIFRRTTFEDAFTAGNISVQPQSGLRDLATLISLLVIDKPWYTPHADGR